MSELLITPLLALHLLCAHVGSAGPLLCMWLEWREARGDAAAGHGGRFLLASALLGLLFATVLGLALGWWLWSDGLSAAVRRVPSKIFFGVWELLFSFGLMLAHWLWWRHHRGGKLTRAIRILLALLAGTNLLYHFPVLFAVLTELIHHRELEAIVIDAADFRQRLTQGAVLARTTHFVLAAIVTCGVLLMLHAARSMRRSDSHAPRDAPQRLAVISGRIALLAAAVQIPTGLWVMTRLPPLAQHRLLGGDAVAVVLMIGGVVLALGLLHVLATIALGESQPQLLHRAALLLAAVVLLMTGTSRRVLAPSAERDAESRRGAPVIELAAAIDYTLQTHARHRHRYREGLSSMETFVVVASTDRDLADRKALDVQAHHRAHAP